MRGRVIALRERSERDDDTVERRQAGDPTCHLGLARRWRRCSDPGDVGTLATDVRELAVTAEMDPVRLIVMRRDHAKGGVLAAQVRAFVSQAAELEESVPTPAAVTDRRERTGSGSLGWP